ncbi:integrase catalytic domain-containing protein [Trichonephila clavipes]|nr:integrase catalytic domain-containing protein [Trichonephila clavipes]
MHALVTDQISATNIPAPELDNIPQAVQLENLVLADSPDCQEPITILIGADYYYDVVTGKIKHLSKKRYYRKPTVCKNQALKITLEATKIFEDASISLHKWQTNSKSLHKAWQNKGVISDENPHFETFEKDNLPYKVLGVAWKSREDFLYFDNKGLIDFVSKRIDTKRFILQVLGRIFDPIGFLGPFTLGIKHLMQKVWLLGVEWDESLPDDIISLWADWCEEFPQLTDFSIPRCYFSDPLVNNFKTLELHLFSDASTKAYETVAYLRVTSNKEILTSFVASKNRIAPLKTFDAPKIGINGCFVIS